jgi:CheY-like chemotaxis protein
MAKTGTHVLVALADPLTLDFYRAGLEAAGFWTTAASSDLVIEEAMRLKPDVIVVDASGPHGLNVCRAIKRESRLHRVPVIAMASPEHSSLVGPFCDAVLRVQCLPPVLIETIDRLVTHARSSS